MSQNPINLAVRFLLEIGALVALGYWGWVAHDGALRWLLALGLPLLAAALWGTFAVPGDRSRSGGAPVPVPGAVRLLLELALFGSAAWALYDAGATTLAWVLAVVAVIHYAVSYDRIVWLLRR
ncbi:MAG: YrdB family protein [Anaerolineae bacterium]|jgi:hypothetical protein